MANWQNKSVHAELCARTTGRWALSGSSSQGNTNPEVLARVHCEDR